MSDQKIRIVRLLERMEIHLEDIEIALDKHDPLAGRASLARLLEVAEAVDMELTEIGREPPRHEV